MNCAQTFIGKNASDKISVLQVISLALNILNNEPINHIPSKYIPGNTKEVISYIYFYFEKTIIKVKFSLMLCNIILVIWT